MLKPDTPSEQPESAQRYTNSLLAQNFGQAITSTANM
jgi:hypothetical protein